MENWEVASPEAEDTEEAGEMAARGSGRRPPTLADGMAVLLVMLLPRLATEGEEARSGFLGCAAGPALEEHGGEEEAVGDKGGSSASPSCADGDGGGLCCCPCPINTAG